MRLDCGNDGWNCGYGLCITSSHRCDGIAHCPNFSDEHNCIQCTEHLCGDGTCIPNWKTCNGVIDCVDGSDEYLLKCKGLFSWISPTYFYFLVKSQIKLDVVKNLNIGHIKY